MINTSSRGLHIYAVAFLTFGENELKIELIEGETWLQAAKSHSKSLFASVADEDITDEFSSVEKAKQFAFDMDGAFDIHKVSLGLDNELVLVPADEEEFGKPITSEQRQQYKQPSEVSEPTESGPIKLNNSDPLAGYDI